jgi:hypothetical protein
MVISNADKSPKRFLGFLRVPAIPLTPDFRKPNDGSSRASTARPAECFLLTLILL